MNVFLRDSAISFNPGYGSSVGEEVKMNSVRFDGPHPFELRPETQSQEEVPVVTKLSLELGLIEPVRSPIKER